MFARFFILASLIVLYACASAPGVSQSLNSLEGKTVDEAVLAFGEPDSVEPLDKSTLYKWTRTYQQPHPTGEFKSGYREQVSCSVYAAVTDDGVINRISADGALNACKLFRQALT